MDKILGLGLGSLAGGFSRVGMGALAARFLPGDFPYGTLIVNLTGCLLIGLLDGLAVEKSLMSPAMRLTLVAGFCGAYTTFSTFLLETNNLLREGDITRAFLYIGASLALGLLSLRAGLTLSRLL